MRRQKITDNNCLCHIAHYYLWPQLNFTEALISNSK